MKLNRLLTIIVVLTCVAATAVAQDKDPAGDGTSDWGVRVGLGSDPDQVIGGFNFLETRIAKNVYLVPNAELGIGDDHLILSATAPFFYRFVTSTSLRPYVGGGVTLGLDRNDKKDDTNFEIALQVSGGLIFPLNSGTEMFAELNLGSGDLRDIQAMVGWRF